MLDAPDLQDDFYLNLVDWGAANILSVGLGTCVYLWSAHTSKVTKLCDLADTSDSVTSVNWNSKVECNDDDKFGIIVMRRVCFSPLPPHTRA